MPDRPGPSASAEPVTIERLVIERLGSRGEGVASVEGRTVYVPYALPGDVVRADREGDRGTLVALVEPSRDRIAPVCRYFTSCGGCAVQALAAAPYAAWKRSLLVDALSYAGVTAEVGPLVDAHGAGRRRATFHARRQADGRVQVGFMQARTHAIVPIDACPVLDPGLAGALAAARALAEALAAPPLSKTGEGDHAERGGGGMGAPRGGGSLDIVATATRSGLDIDLRGHGPLDDDARARLVAVSLAQGLARLSNHGTIVIESRKSLIGVGQAHVAPPPGAFLQATGAGERALADRVTAALAGAKRVADLFAGVGTFALHLAENAEVTAYDTEAPALAALARAARDAPTLRPVATETRDLFRRPLGAEELARFDAVVIDPPRAGAEAQMRAIAASTIVCVASVACDAQTFARDAAILVAAGFVADRIEPIDQFRYSAHIEIFAAFRRASPKRKRRLLG